MINFSDINELKKQGWVGFIRKHELFEDCTSIPKIKGVYLVLRTLSTSPKFLDVGCGGFFKGKNPNVTIGTLVSSWIPTALVVYIGKAGGSNSSATLYSRLRQYLAFGRGKAVGHWGGRYIWQLEHSEELVVCWRPLPNDEPRIIERQLIDAFVKQFGKRPFANLAD
jgi:hypothetical protein